MGGEGTYLRDGDQGFIGLNSRDNPSSLQQGYVSESINYRLDRGVATPRRGLQRKTIGSIVGLDIYGSCTYIDSNGQEIIVLVTERDLWYYNPQNEVLSLPVPFPSRQIGGTFTSATVLLTTVVTVTKASHGYTTGDSLSIVASNSSYSGIYTITVTGTNTFTYVIPSVLALTTGTCDMSIEYINTSDGCDVVSALDKVFISRGHLKRPLVWDMGTTITMLPASTSTGHQFPNCTQILYYGNRLVAQGKYHNDPNNFRRRDTVCVSNYLDYEHWDILDAFTFNNGSNDEVIAIAPWTLNEFTVFMRHSIFYVNIGIGRYTTGDALSNDCFIKTLVTDVGCIAKRSVVQANGGIIFLSDNGVYAMNPTQVGSNESMRLLTSAQPISAPINDVIKRINKTYAYRSVAVYWDNRYYLAVPLDNSNKNNAVLIYNFILNAWESVDTYPSGIDVFNFIVAKKNDVRRLFIIDSNEGVFLTEELDYDEYGTQIGKPIIPYQAQVDDESASFRLDSEGARLQPLAFTPLTIPSSLKTRRYTFGSFNDKRFSSAEIDFNFEIGSQISTFVDVSNEDSYSKIDEYTSPSSNDETRRTPIRKFGTGLRFQFLGNFRPFIRSVYAYASQKTKNLISKK